MSSSHEEHSNLNRAPSLESPPPPDQPSNECTDCGAALTGAYCADCGQRAASRVVPLWQVSNEFLEDLFDLDLRIIRTFPTFFFRPGRLTEEYVHGRRRRYIRPLRLYLFSSFLLFTVLAFTHLNGFSLSFSPETAAMQREVEAARSRIDSLQTAVIESVTTNGPLSDEHGGSATDRQAAIEAIDKEIESLEAALGPTEAAAGVTETLVTTLASPALEEPAVPASPTQPSVPVQAKVLRILDSPRDFVREMIDRAPYLMFLLVPTFALLLKALYLRRRRLYLEHIIFALHVHALAFIAFAMSSLLGSLNVGASVSLSWWLAVSPFAYLYLAMRHVYSQSLLSTLGKMAILLVAYGIILVGAVVLLAVVTVSLM